MIWNFIPYCPATKGAERFVGKDLGLAYDMYMGLVGPDDWVVMMDHDAMHLTPGWYRRFEAAVAVAAPDVGCFVPMTNRLVLKRSGWQMAGDMESDDIRYHRRIARQLAESRDDLDMVDVTNIHERPGNLAPLSGFCFCVRKAAWDDIGGVGSGFMHRDHELHKRLAIRGWRVVLLRRMYVFHWFRGRQK